MLFAACDNYDDFTDAPDATLRFSADTVSFDTLFASVPSVTKTLIVWNDADKGVRIRDVRIENGKSTYYRVNVDGEYLDGSLRDLEIRAGDSLFVFAEITLEAVVGGASKDSVTVDDALLFTLSNGKTQRVALHTTAVNAEIYPDGMTIKADTLFTNDSKRVIYGALRVEKGATLTLEAGTTLYFHTGAELHVYGSLVSKGTLEQPVTLRGDRLDRLFKNLPYDNTVGRWGGVHIHGSSPSNELTYTDIHSGDYGVVVDSSQVVMDGCILHNIGGNGLVLLSSNAAVSNCQFSNTRGNCVSVYGGASDFMFCTMAQYYPWEADRGAALFIGDYLLDIQAPIESALFTSCLMTGYADDVLMGDIKNEKSGPYQFRNCVLRTPEVPNDSHYVNVVWELPKNDPKEDDKLPKQGYRQFALMDLDNFLYDFRPFASSHAANAADPEDVKYSPKDRLGVLRKDSITAGCYQTIPNKEEEKK